ncbi:type-F conjugative transfer system pilin assembly protein TrbC (plasmid) [Cedecea neteri]|uniref:type-F conjugative transfer system pilin assembly protein TrbC n=1 Tax=Cedecea neteri TaxID=158822 RepID=UPI002892B0D8|nr:type-F conjugative transfer system pilin assembly protein TrbC [Cedecea neteri]WNJ82283.1 type-F conjugative transfer system pilin assembly protein TrbC [Cedecea neteri]
MNLQFLKTAVMGSLLFFVVTAAASEQVNVSGRDMNWMKQQQQALKDFQSTLQGQQFSLPQEQQDLVSRLQQGIQSTQADDDKKTYPAVYFVSLGIPREGLLLMLKDAKRFGVPATLRGLLNNDMRQTAAEMFELTKEDKDAGVQIDPTLYSEYGITAVPALVVTCPGHFDVVKGSLPLQEALEKVSTSGECAATARQILEGAK